MISATIADICNGEDAVSRRARASGRDTARPGAMKHLDRNQANVAVWLLNSLIANKHRFGAV